MGIKNEIVIQSGDKVKLKKYSNQSNIYYWRLQDTHAYVCTYEYINRTERENGAMIQKI